MTTPQLPYVFGGAAGDLELSQFDETFGFLLDLILAQDAATIPFNDTVGLGAGSVQAAIVALFERISAISVGQPTPHISYSAPTLTAPVAPGTSAGAATVTGLSGGTWSISPTTYFDIDSSSGAVSASTTVGAGSYAATLTYSVPSAGQTVSVSLQTSIVVSASGSTDGLMDFSNPDQSGLAGN
jgi:hypothetical protein